MLESDGTSLSSSQGDGFFLLFPPPFSSLPLPSLSLTFFFFADARVRQAAVAALDPLVSQAADQSVSSLAAYRTRPLTGLADRAPADDN